MLTLTSIHDHVTHELDTVPESLRNGVAPGTGATESLWLANMAGRYFYETHQWSFRQRPEVSLNFTAGQDYIELPADFGEEQVVEQQSSQYGAFSFADLRTFMSVRQSNTTPGADYWGAIFQPAQTAQTADMPARRLYLWPTPAEDVTGALRMFYLADWTDLTGASDKPALPGYCEMLYVDLVRKMARGLVDDSLDARMNAWRSSLVFASTVAKDGMTQSDHGVLRGSVLNNRGNAHHEIRNVIPGPA